MSLQPLFLLFSACIIARTTDAQQSFDLLLPDIQIVADRVTRGDGDTYGLGDWKCSFGAELNGTNLSLNGKISFTEKANDFTTIVGLFQHQMEVGELARCQHCYVTLDENQGTVSGPNIGARGYRWFNGQGLIRRANIQSDVFGTDAGNIGGTIQFVPIRVLVDCSIAQTKTDSVVPIYAARVNPD